MEDGPRLLFYFGGGVGGLFGALKMVQQGHGFELLIEKRQNDHVEICLTRIAEGCRRIIEWFECS